MRTITARLVVWTTSLSLVAATVAPGITFAQAPAAAKAKPGKPAKKKGLKDSLTGDARAAFDRAVTLFEAKNFEGALAEFDRAYQQAKDPRLLFNMAIAERELKRYSRAVAKLNQELKEGADTLSDDEKKTAEEVLAGLKEFTAPLTVVVNEPDATILIDGNEVGKSPLDTPVTADVGERTVTVKKPTFLDAAQKLNISGGVAAKVEFKLEPAIKNGKLAVKALGAPSAIVWVDGVEAGPAPWEGELKEGKHSIEVRSKGYVTEARTLDVEYKKTSAIEITLRVDEGKASIKTDKDTTEIFIDGNSVGKGAWTGTLSTGGHALELRRKGAKTFQTELTIATGQTITREYKLESTGGTPWWVWAGAGVVIVGGAVATYALTRPKTEDAQPGTINPGTVPVGLKFLRPRVAVPGRSNMALRLRRALGVTLGLGLLGAPLATGCAKKKPSAIVVSLSSEAPVPEELDSMEILVQRGDDTRHLGQYTLDVSAGDTRLPGTLTLQKEDAEESSVAITVTVTASAGQKKRVLRKATLGFSDEKTKLLKMPLRYSCFDFKEICGPNEECIGGVCESTRIDVETLPEYEDRLVFGTTAARTCFDESDAGCFAGASTLSTPAAALVDAADGTCTVALGAAGRGGQGLNVGLRWSASGSLGRFATLEHETGRLIEGFKHDGNGNVQLPKGLCAAIKDGRVAALRASTACVTKATEQPLCVFKDSVCKADMKPGTLATSACFQCLYAPAAPKNCAALLDEARCDDASRAYLACLLDTPFNGFKAPADCPEPRRASCATTLGECANDLSGAACKQKYAKLLAYVACADDVNGGLPDDSAADLAAALARCQEPCGRDGYVQGCTSSMPTSYVQPLPPGNYTDGKGNYVVVGPTDVQLRSGANVVISLVSSEPKPAGANTTRYVAKVLSATTGAPDGGEGGAWPTATNFSSQSSGLLWVQSFTGNVRVDLTLADATTPGTGFATAGPFATGGADTTCGTANQQKFAFCNGNDLITCDPSTKSPVSSKACTSGCQFNPGDQNDACKAGSSVECSQATPQKTKFCAGDALLTCNPDSKSVTSSTPCPDGCDAKASDQNDACKASGFSTVCSKATPAKTEFCDGSVLVSCNFESKQPVSSAPCSAGLVCMVAAAAQNDTCVASSDACSAATTEKTMFCGPSDELITCDPSTKKGKSAVKCQTACVSQPQGVNDQCGGGGGGFCGDGVVSPQGSPTEECDDGKPLSGDGCSADCKIESGYLCGDMPSKCLLAPAGCGQCVAGSPCNKLLCTSSQCYSCAASVALGSTPPPDCASDPEFAAIAACVCTSACKSACDGFCP